MIEADFISFRPTLQRMNCGLGWKRHHYWNRHCCLRGWPTSAAAPQLSWVLDRR